MNIDHTDYVLVISGGVMENFSHNLWAMDDERAVASATATLESSQFAKVANTAILWQGRRQVRAWRLHHEVRLEDITERLARGHSYRKQEA